MHRALLVLLVFIFSQSSLAAIVVKSLEAGDAILVETTADETLSLGDKLPIVDQDMDRVVGFAKITSLPGDNSLYYVATVTSHSENLIIRAGDQLLKVDYSKANPNFTGRADLRLRGKGVSSRYKPLTLVSREFETAEPLDRGENLITLSTIYYLGLTSRLTLGTWVLNDTLGLPNIKAKYKVYDSEDIALAIAAEEVYFPANKQNAVTYQFYADVHSNAKLISHTNITLVDSSLSGFLGDGKVKAVQSSSIKTGYEYIFDNWNRLLLGPLYNLNKKTLGGFFYYVFIWDHFHLQVGVTSQDFTDYRVNPEANQFSFDLYWRF